MYVHRVVVMNGVWLSIHKQYCSKFSHFIYVSLTIYLTTPHLCSAAEERKKVEDREYHKRYQDVLFKENQENLERKAEQRAKAFLEEK